MKRIIARSKNNRLLFGVCGGLADFFTIDPTLCRIIFLLGAFLTGSLLFWLYLLLAIIMPTKK